MLQLLSLLRFIYVLVDDAIFGISVSIFRLDFYLFLEEEVSLKTLKVMVDFYLFMFLIALV